ncbi:MAG: hypothetical protein WAZ12_01650 [Candidatus Absconditicoccaceae bacterium]
MNRQKKVMKVLIIIIFAVFMLSTGLVTVMYLTDPSKTTDGELTGENLTGTTIQTGLNLTGNTMTGAITTGTK